MGRLRVIFTITLFFGGMGLILLALFARQIPLLKGMNSIAQTEEESQGPLVCNPSFIDFGRDYRINRRIIDQSYIIENKSSEPVTLNVADKSCACAVAELSSRVVPPGKSTILKTRWEVPYRLGKNDFWVTVKSNTPDGPWVRVGGKITLVDVVNATPDAIDFGDLKRDQVKTSRVMLAASPGEPLAAGISVPASAGQSSEITLAVVNKTASIIDVDVSVKGVPGLGKQEYLVPTRTGEAVQKEILLKIIANHLEDFYAKPSALMFSVIREKEQGKWVTIMTSTNQPIEIVKMAPDRPEVISVRQRRNEANELQVGIFPLVSAKLASYESGSIEVYVRGQKKPITIRYLILGN